MHELFGGIEAWKTMKAVWILREGFLRRPGCVDRVLTFHSVYETKFPYFVGTKIATKRSGTVLNINHLETERSLYVFT